MMRSLLYYPTFLPPSLDWVKQSLLFWDSFSTIVPARHAEEVDTPELQYLQSEGAFRPLEPYFYDHHGSDLGRELVQELETRLDSPEVQSQLAACGDNGVYYVSVLKMTYGVQQVFRKRGLIPDDNEWHEWYAIKRPAALLYMSLLARLMADHNSSHDHLQPCTDSHIAQRIAFEGGREVGVRLTLTEALPQVRDDATLEDVLRFRTTRRQELLRFREFMDSFQDKIAGTETTGDLGREFTRFREKLERELADLGLMMTDAGLKGKLGSLQSLAKVSAPGIIAAAGAGGLTADPQIAAIAGGLALAGGGAIALADVLLSGRERRRQMASSPVSYLISARKEELI